MFVEDFVVEELPKKLGKLLVQAYQAYLFNRILSAMIEAGIETRNSRILLVGFRSELSEGTQGEIEKTLLEEEGITAKDFFIDALPELSSEGATRNATVAVGLEITCCVDETSRDAQIVIFRFALAPGSYATVVLREFMKAHPSDY